MQTKSSLTASRRRLLELMQVLNHGHIEGLLVRDGEPVFDPIPRIIRDVKFCSENGPRPESNLDNFDLKAQVRDLFSHLDTLGNGTIRRLEVQRGLPFRMQVEEVTA